MKERKTFWKEFQIKKKKREKVGGKLTKEGGKKKE